MGGWASKVSHGVVRGWGVRGKERVSSSVEQMSDGERCREEM